MWPELRPPRPAPSRLAGPGHPAPAVALDRHDPRHLGPEALGVANLSGCMVPSGPTRLTARHAVSVRPSLGVG